MLKDDGWTNSRREIHMIDSCGEDTVVGRNAVVRIDPETQTENNNALASG